jgi:competence protein ComEC
MTTAATPPAVSATARPSWAVAPSWQAPLVPVAVAVTVGILLDRSFVVPLAVSLIAASASLLAFFLHIFGSHRLLGLLYLWAGCLALGGAWHHVHQHGAAADDVRHCATEQGAPARLRGIVDSPPTLTKGTGPDPLRSMAKPDATRFVLNVTAAQDLANRRWESASGLVQVRAPAGTAVAAGDKVEIVGRLSLPETPGNPGEFDYATFLGDRQVSALLSVRDGANVIVLDRGWAWSPTSWPGVVRSWSQDVLIGALPAPQGDLAAALLLGESPGMTSDDWDLYLRTGVIHVLAISGQHLVVLAGFLWFGLRLARVRRRQGAAIVAMVLLFYALVAGGRPPVMRSAWMVLAYAGAALLQRPTQPANTFALAWLLVALWNPADVCNAGCQLSFLAVAVLIWGVPGITALSSLLRFNLFGARDPLQQAIDENRPLPLQLLFALLRAVAEAYLLSALVWLAVAPLVAYHFHLVSPIALVLGPPLVLLTSIALLAGFAVLLVAPIAAPLAWPFAFATRWSLAGCAGLTELGANLPGAYFYVPDVPAWWLGIFYGTLLLGLAVGAPRRYPRAAIGALVAGFALSMVVILWPHRSSEFRCTFLAVGHGGCAVIETPGGSVLLYDAGSIAGPDLTRRQIAPFLWSRGIRRIDELIVSHADLDHFNGIPELVQRFAVRQVTHTPTFPQRDFVAVRVALAAIERRGIATRVVSAGDRWKVDGLAIEVLHPPAEGPDGKENARSMVLLLRHGERSVLLTGDLEDAGLTQVLAMPTRPVDVLMAPHHGSARSNTAALAQWASPRIVVMCQGRSDNTNEAARAYSATRSVVLGTWPHGAVTLRQNAAQAWVETFRTDRIHILPQTE